MQRIMNDPDNIVDEMLQGFLKAHSDIVEGTENKRVIKAKHRKEGKVGAASYTHMTLPTSGLVLIHICRGLLAINTTTQPGPLTSPDRTLN